MVQDLLRHASEGRCRINCHLQAVTIGPQSINILVRLQVKMDRMIKCSARHKLANAMQVKTSSEVLTRRAIGRGRRRTDLFFCGDTDAEKRVNAA